MTWLTQSTLETQAALTLNMHAAILHKSIRAELLTAILDYKVRLKSLCFPSYKSPDALRGFSFVL